MAVHTPAAAEKKAADRAAADAAEMTGWPVEPGWPLARNMAAAAAA